MKVTNKDFFDTIKLILTSSLLAVGGIFFPVLFLFFPVQFLTESTKRGFARVFLSFVGVCLVTGLIMGARMGLTIFALFGPLLIVFDYCIRTGQRVDVTMGAATAILLVSTVFTLYITGVLSSIQSGSFFEDILTMQKNIMGSVDLGGMSQDQMLGQFREVLSLVHTLLPSLILLSSFLVVYFSYTMAGRRLLMQGKAIKQPSSFLFFSLPRQLVISGVIIAAGLFLVSSLWGVNVELLQKNLIFTMGVLLFFQGASVLSYFVHRMSPSVFPRILMWAAIFLVPGMQFGVAIVGLLDQGLDFRKLGRQ